MERWLRGLSWGEGSSANLQSRTYIWASPEDRSDAAPAPAAIPGLALGCSLFIVARIQGMKVETFVYTPGGVGGPQETMPWAVFLHTRGPPESPCEIEQVTGGEQLSESFPLTHSSVTSPYVHPFPDWLPQYPAGLSPPAPTPRTVLCLPLGEDPIFSPSFIQRSGA